MYLVNSYTIYLISEQIIVEANKRLSNIIYSQMQAISDKTFADWERVRKYSVDGQPEIKVYIILPEYYSL